MGKLNQASRKDDIGPGLSGLAAWVPKRVYGFLQAVNVLHWLGRVLVHLLYIWSPRPGWCMAACESAASEGTMYINQLQKAL